jgi:enediyne biosynthesis protein E5
MHAMTKTRGAATAEGKDRRLSALRRFAASITIFTVAGAFVFGFEDPWVQPLVAIACAYALELLLASIEARAHGREPKYAGGPMAFVNFLLPAHIAALSIALLLYAGERMWPIVLAVAVAIGSKYILRVRINGRSRHFMNPSNLGIVVVLLAFPWVGISPPYHFTENLTGFGDWAIPVAILIAGTLLNMGLTGKAPLIMGFLFGMLMQAVIRVLVFGGPIAAPLLPVTGVLFAIYMNYMITDPGTTPTRWMAQAAFGMATAAVYGILVAFHVVFGLFFALTIVCAARGLSLALYAAWPAAVRRLVPLRVRRPAGAELAR